MTNENITDIKDLKGHTIHIFGQGATSDVLLRRILQQKEIDSVKIDYSYTTNKEISKALRLKKIKVAVVSEPMVSSLIAQDPSIHIIAKLKCETYMDNTIKDIFLQTAFLVSDKFAKEHSALVEQVCEAYSNSCNFTSEQPEVAAKLLVEHNFSPNIEIAVQSIPLCNIRYVAAFALQREVKSYLNIFYNYNPKSIGDKIPDPDFIYQTY